MLRNQFFKNSQQSNLPAKSTTQNVSTIIYVLQLISMFTAGMFALIPLLLAYIFRFKNNEEWLDSHFRWQIQTFWFSSIFYFISFVFFIIPFLGWIVAVPSLILATLIILVRSIKGLTRLSSQNPPQNLIE